MTADCIHPRDNEAGIGQARNHQVGRALVCARWNKLCKSYTAPGIAVPLVRARGRVKMSKARKDLAHALLDGRALGVAGGVVVGFALLTLCNALLHRLYHHSDLLWRWVHQLHHSPQRLDVAGSVLFTPQEVAINVAMFQLLIVAVLGLDPVAAAIVGFLAAFYGMFQHFNIRTPAPVMDSVRSWIGSPRRGGDSLPTCRHSVRLDKHHLPSSFNLASYWTHVQHSWTHASRDLPGTPNLHLRPRRIPPVCGGCGRARNMIDLHPDSRPGVLAFYDGCTFIRTRLQPRRSDAD